MKLVNVAYSLRTDNPKILNVFVDNVEDMDPRIFKSFTSQMVIQGWLAVDTFIFLRFASF